MARQEIRNKLQQADNEVMEAYRKISQARSKKKPPTKKEREQAWKALKERDIILKQLESVWEKWLILLMNEAQIFKNISLLRQQINMDK